MYVCICKAITLEQIKELVKNGKSLKDIVQTTKAGSDCGSCIDSIISEIKKGNK